MKTIIKIVALLTLLTLFTQVQAEEEIVNRQRSLEFTAVTEGNCLMSGDELIEIVENVLSNSRIEPIEVDDAYGNDRDLRVSLVCEIQDKKINRHVLEIKFGYRGGMRLSGGSWSFKKINASNREEYTRQLHHKVEKNLTSFITHRFPL